MSLPRPLTPVVRFLAGVSYIPGGLVFLVRNPRLWPVAISPLIVAAILLMIGARIHEHLAAAPATERNEG